MHENDIAREIVDIAYKMHTRIGPGLLESVYERVMQFELEKRGFKVEHQRGVPLSLCDFAGDLPPSLTSLRLM